MRIAIWHNLPSGGGKRALHGQVAGLVERGHYVESWCPSTADQKYLPLGELVREHIVPLILPKLPGRWSLLKRLSWRRAYVLNRLEAMESHCRNCVREIESRGFDILLAGSCTFFRTSPIGRQTALPSVLYLQEPYRWLFEALPQLPWVAADPPSWHEFLSPRWIIAYVKSEISVGAARVQLREELRNARGFSVLLVNSLFSRESVLRAYGMDAHFCPLGVDVDQFPFSKRERKPQVISLGLLYYGKGAERSINALAMIPSHKRPTLLWVGNGFDSVYHAQIAKLAKRLEVEFIFRSDVSDEELINHLQESFAMIYTPRLEPFGYAPLEANCCGTPVVAIAEGGVRETIHDGVNGLTVPGGDPAALASALLRLVDDPELVARLRLTSRQYVETFWSVNKAIDHLERELYAALAKNRA